jgi:outer membrane lipoprotein-sorting protein
MEMRNSMMPMVRVVKLRVGQTMGPEQGPGTTPDEAMDQLKKQFDFVKVDSATIDGRSMYVLEGTPKAGQPEARMLSKIMYFFDQETLVMRRMVTLDKAGKESSRFDLTNVKTNGELDPKLFDYTPPPGVQVQDMTGR